MRPMLATAAPLPHGPDWVYEVKWDGMRLLVDVRAEPDAVGGGRRGVRLTSRTERDVTVAFPEVAASIGSTHADVLLDGEVVVLEAGVPSFAALAERMHLRDPRRVAEAARRWPVTFLAFDVLRLYGVDLRARPFSERRASLERLAHNHPGIRLSPLYDDADALVEATREQGLEGVVAKRRRSTYQAGRRSPDWVKLAHRQVSSALVVGWRPETDGGSGRIGALLLAVPDAGGELRFAGRVGSGLATAEQDVRQRLAPLHRTTAPLADPVPRLDAVGARWVEPAVVVDVEHLGRTEGGRLRHPVFRGVREDLSAADLAADERVPPAAKGDGQ